MKFKKLKGEDIKALTITDADGGTLDVVRYGASKELYIGIQGISVIVKKSKALKLAHAIIAELDPENMWVMG